MSYADAAQMPVVHATDNEEAAFEDISAIRQRRKRKIKNKIYEGTGTFSGMRFPEQGTEKLFVSLPFRNFPLKELKKIISEATGTELKIKKRSSTRGYSSPFEIYGNTDHISKIKNPAFWGRGTKINFYSRYFRLPRDYYEEDQLSESLSSKSNVDGVQLSSAGSPISPM
jgi:hypothetical protein